MCTFATRHPRRSAQVDVPLKPRLYRHPHGVCAVYGERLEQLYGQLLPIPAARVRVVEDGERVRLGGRTLELIHVPGHALHHYAVVDPAHASIFAGDTFGISYRSLDSAQGAFITPTTPPSQFDPEQLIASIERMLAYRPESVYLMHFSRVTGVARSEEHTSELQSRLHLVC